MQNKINVFFLYDNVTSFLSCIFRSNILDKVEILCTVDLSTFYITGTFMDNQTLVNGYFTINRHWNAL